MGKLQFAFLIEHKRRLIRGLLTCKLKVKKDISNTFLNGGEYGTIFIFNSTRKHVLTYKIRYIPTSVWYIRKESAENVSTVGVISAEKGERKFKSDS